MEKSKLEQNYQTENGTWPAIWMLPENPTTGWPTSGRDLLL